MLLYPTNRANAEHAIKFREVLGFGQLAAQVLGKQKDQNISAHDVLFFSPDSQNLCLVKEESPLPVEISKNPVTNAIVQTIENEYIAILKSEADDSKSLASGGRANRLPNLSLSTGEFEKLGKLLAQEYWPIISSSTDLKQRLEYQVLKEAQGQAPEQKCAKLNFTNLFVMYLMEYYNGNYVDRYGVAYDKPKLDFRITNDAIVAFANIFQETLWDFALMTYQEKVKDPVVYKTGHPDIFINGTGKKPSLAKILREQHKPETAIPGLVEEVRTDASKNPSMPGLTNSEVCVVHYFSGLAGDASELLSSMFIRRIGGLSGGFVIAYGKFSIGDNETLGKLIDASVKTYGKRSTDLVFSTLLYRSANIKKSLNDDAVNVKELKRKKSSTSPWTDTDERKLQETENLLKEKQSNWDWIQKHVDISKFLDCYKQN